MQLRIFLRVPAVRELFGREAPLPRNGAKDRRVDHLDEPDGSGVQLLDDVDNLGGGALLDLNRRPMSSQSLPFSSGRSREARSFTGACAWPTAMPPSRSGPRATAPARTRGIEDEIGESPFSMSALRPLSESQGAHSARQHWSAGPSQGRRPCTVHRGARRRRAPACTGHRSARRRRALAPECTPGGVHRGALALQCRQRQHYRPSVPDWHVLHGVTTFCLSLFSPCSPPLLL